MLQIKSISQHQTTLATDQNRESNIRNRKFILYQYICKVIKVIIAFQKLHPEQENIYKLLIKLAKECQFDNEMIPSQCLSHMEKPSILNQQFLKCDEDRDQVQVIKEIDYNFIQMIHNHSLIKNDIFVNETKTSRLHTQYLKIHDISKSIIQHFTDFLILEINKILFIFTNEIISKNSNQFINEFDHYLFEFEKCMCDQISKLIILNDYLLTHNMEFSAYHPKKFHEKLNDLINYDQIFVQLIDQFHYLNDALI